MCHACVYVPCVLKKQKRFKFDANQSQITDYFTIAKEINDIVKGNPSLSNLIKENGQHNNAKEFLTSLLQQLFKNAQTNAESREDTQK